MQRFVFPLILLIWSASAQADWCERFFGLLGGNGSKAAQALKSTPRDGAEDILADAFLNIFDKGDDSIVTKESVQKKKELLELLESSFKNKDRQFVNQLGIPSEQLAAMKLAFDKANIPPSDIDSIKQFVNNFLSKNNLAEFGKLSTVLASHLRERTDLVIRAMEIEMMEGMLKTPNKKFFIPRLIKTKNSWVDYVNSPLKAPTGSEARVQAKQLLGYLESGNPDGLNDKTIFMWTLNNVLMKDRFPKSHKNNRRIVQAVMDAAETLWGVKIPKSKKYLAWQAGIIDDYP